MRFAYIDSKGKEIELDSVEALALRIELGAIADDTKLYDASQDRWAPAKEHPIFQSLSSGKAPEEVGEAAATAAPPEPEPGAGEPPKAKAGPPKPKAGPPKPKKKKKEAEEPPPAEDEAPAPEAETGEEAELPDAASEFLGPEMEGAVAEVHEPEVAEDAEPVSFADVMGEEEEEEEADEPAEAEAGAEEGAGDVLDMDMDLAEGPAEEEEAPAAPEEEPAAEAAAEPEEPEEEEPEEEASSFDLGGPLELEEEEAAPSIPGTEEPEPEEEEPEPEAAGEPAAGGGLELEGALDWAGLDTEEEDAAAGAPPARDRKDMFGPEEGAAGEPEPTSEEAEAASAGGEGLELEPAHAAGAAETGSASAGAATEAPPDAEDEEEARTRPSAPKPSHWKERSLQEEKSGGIGKVLVMVVLLAAAGGGGWYFFMGPGSSRAETGPGQGQLPPAPELPARLVPTMNAVGGPAMTALVERTDSLWAARGAPEAPGRPWLTGPYFANAGDYAYIEDYWRAIEGFVADLRERDETLFREAVVAQLRAGASEEEAAAEEEGAEVPEEDVEAIADRAEWEFLAASAQVNPYAPVESLAHAALRLHDLLLAREPDILTEAEGGGFGTADPILEVIVQDDSLRASMNEHLDQVFRALAETETPTPVTTRGLMAALYGKVRRAAFP